MADDLDLPVMMHVQETRMQVVTASSGTARPWSNISIASAS